MEKQCNEYNVDFALFMDRFYDFWLVVCITTDNRYDDKKNLNNALICFKGGE